MQRPYELVIFDCDGVLVDSERLAAKVGAEILTELGWPVTADEVLRRFIGCTDEYWRSEVEAQIGRPLPADFDQAHRYEEVFAAELVAVPGVVEALEVIDIASCVASNGGHDKLRLNLQRTGLADYFEGRVFSAADVAKGKPAPDLFLHAAASMGVSPDRCVVIEDSPPGVAAASAAGMDCLAYAGGVIPADQLADSNARLFHDMRDLPALVSGDGGMQPPGRSSCLTGTTSSRGAG